MRKILLLVILILILGSAAFGADYTIDTALDFAQKFTGSDAMETVFTYARSLFIGLATLSLAFGLIRMLLNGESNLGTVFSLLTRWILYVGIFTWIMSPDQDVVQMIINSFVAIGGKVNGTAEIAPDNIMSAGIRIYGNIVEQSWNAGWGDFTGVIFLGLIILVAVALIAGLFALALIEMHLVLCGGAVLLGFGGFEYTRDIALSYLKYAISVGVKLLMVMIVYKFASQTVIDWEASFNKAADMSTLITSAGQILGGMICILMAVYYIPKAAQGIVNRAVMTFGVPSNQVVYATLTGSNAPVEVRKDETRGVSGSIMDAIRSWGGRYREASGAAELIGNENYVSRDDVRHEEGMLSGAGYRPMAEQGGAKQVKNPANAEAMTNYIKPDNAYVRRESINNN